MMIRRPLALASAFLLVGGLAACTDKADDDASGSARTIAVSSTSDACNLEKTSAAAGKLTFDVKNDGTKTTEFYLLKSDGKEVLGEVENIGPGTSRPLAVDLTAGTYIARCKPGMTGKGIDVSFKVTGSGGTPQAAPDRTITFDAIDFEYEKLDLSGIAKGDTIRFEMANSGAQPHEFEVLDPSGDAVGEVAAVDSGQTGRATVTFEAPGTYTYQCILVDKKTGKKHTMLGMTGTFEVDAS